MNTKEYGIIIQCVIRVHLGGLLRQLISTVVKNVLKRLRKSPLFAPLIHILPYTTESPGDAQHHKITRAVYSQ